MGLGGRFKREGTYLYLWLIHIVVWQKPRQHCKATVPQLKKKMEKSQKKKKKQQTQLKQPDRACTELCLGSDAPAGLTLLVAVPTGRGHTVIWLLIRVKGDSILGPLRPPNPQTTCTLSTSSSELNWILKIQGPGSNQSLHLKSPPNYFHPNYLSGLTMTDHQTSFFYNWKMQLKRRHNYSVSQTIEYLRSTLHNLD